jgi:hypothetical protein
MNHLYSFSVVACTVALSMCLCGGCGENVKVADESEGPISPRFWDGQRAARQYAAGELADYEVVWEVYDLDAAEWQPFLDGFAEGLTEASKQTPAAAHRAVLEEAITGNQFQTAKDLGSKHARKAITNEQIQGIIHSSLGVSRGVALGWKAGYIRGFAAHFVAERAATGSVDEETIRGFHREGGVTYQALRSAIGQ